MQGRENAHAGENAGGNVGDRRSSFHGRAASPFSGNTHQSAHALSNEVEAAAIGVWPGPPEARDRAVNQFRIHLVQNVVTESHFFHRAAPVILDQHVGIFQQTRQDAASRLRLQI